MYNPFDFFNRLVFGWITLFRMAADDINSHPGQYPPH